MAVGAEVLIAVLRPSETRPGQRQRAEHDFPEKSVLRIGQA